MSLVWVACGKDDPIRFEFQTDTENYFSYKNGAQWIYKLNNGATLDTVTSVDFAMGMADRPEGVAAVSSSTLIGTKEEKVIVRAEAIPNQSLDRIAVLILENGAFQPGPVLLNLNGEINAEDSSVAIKLLTLDVAGQQYDDIWEIEMLAHPIFRKLWFAKGRGIIKKIYINNDTFDLIKFSPGN